MGHDPYPTGRAPFWPAVFGTALLVLSVSVVLAIALFALWHGAIDGLAAMIEAAQ